MLYIGNYHDKFGLNRDIFRKKINFIALMKKQQHIRHTNTVALKKLFQKVKSIKNFFLFFQRGSVESFDVSKFKAANASSQVKYLEMMSKLLTKLKNTPNLCELFGSLGQFRSLGQTFFVSNVRRQRRMRLFFFSK